MTTETPAERRPSDGVTEPIHVLVVDDDPHLLTIAEELLAREDGFEVETAENALDACRTLREGTVDCVVSDYRMPAVDGMDLLETIRETEDIPFVMFTNKGSPELEARVEALGDTAYLSKGLGLERYELLAETVREIVGTDDRKVA
jgi:DNA-binding NtrC family response regulator